MAPKAECVPELWLAVESGDVDWARQILDAGGNPHTRYQGCTPFMKAAENNDVKIMELPLERGAEPDATNRKGRTALSFAAAPSNRRADNGRRETAAMNALGFLLAMPEVWILREDSGGLTARARAVKEDRFDAAGLLEHAEEQLHRSRLRKRPHQGAREGGRRRGTGGRMPASAEDVSESSLTDSCRRGSEDYEQDLDDAASPWNAPRSETEGETAWGDGRAEGTRSPEDVPEDVEAFDECPRESEVACDEQKRVEVLEAKREALQKEIERIRARAKAAKEARAISV